MIRHEYFCIILIFIIILCQTKQQNDIVANLVNEVQQQTNRICLCTKDEICDNNTNTCRLKHPDHTCYQSWTKEIGVSSIQVTAGCITNDFLWTLILCNNNQSDRYIICCTDKDYCNDRNAFAGDIRRQLGEPDTPIQMPNKKLKVLIISAAVLIFLFLALLLIYFIRKKILSGDTVKFTQSKSFSRCLCQQSEASLPEGNNEENSRSSSGYGEIRERTRFLEPITFTKQITLEERIGIGGYGCVYRGRWHGDIIAVKIFLSSEEASWSREVEIYKTPGLNHENILRYIAADNIDISCQIELWLATEYHENGSVYDYLMNHTINTRILSRMIYSIVNGLWHLHVPIDATNGRVAFAHRDIKTKNILVKRDLSCCIADLGLAVKEVRERQINNNNEERVVIDIKPNHRVGTIRYMAPEILDRTLNSQSFISYKAADIYALGLVFWEILRRCRMNSQEDDADPYELPYQDILPNNPTFDQMRDVVCVQKYRPNLSSRWRTNPIADYLSNLCQEIWSENPSFRPDIFYIRDQLRHRIESIDNDLKNSTIESRNQGPQTV